MDKKTISRVANVNLSFLIIIVFATLTFVSSLKSALWPLLHGGVLNDINFSMIQVKLNVTYQGGYNNTYIIGYYPLIGIVAGIIYNSFILIKNYRSERTKKIEL